MLTRLCVILAVATLAACGGSKDAAPAAESAPAPNADVALALAVARGIDAAPAATDSVLRANGLTKAGFDSLMLRIAADSALSAQFTAQR